MFGPSIHKHCKVVKVDRRTANKNVSVTDLQRRNITKLGEVVTNFVRVPRFRKKNPNNTSKPTCERMHAFLNLTHKKKVFSSYSAE